MPTMAQALERIKGQVTAVVPEELIRQLCDEVGHPWRDRELGPVVTTYLFLEQILHGNLAVGELRRRANLSFTDAAYCQARRRLPRRLLERLQQTITGRLRNADGPPAPTWQGHRLFLLDGSSFSMPDTPALRRHFGQPSGQAEGCGFPVAHLMVLCDAEAGYLCETQAAPLTTSDLSQTPVLHAALHEDDVLIGDRAFGTYAHLALCRRRKLQGIFRAHQKIIVDFTPHRWHVTEAQRRQGAKGRPTSRWLQQLGQDDQLVEYFKPKKRPAWLTAEEYAALPASQVVRELRYTIREPGRRTRVVTLVTTLLDPERYAAAELARLYGLRWRVETNLKHLKTTLGLDILRCKTVEGVLKELTVFVLIYNLVWRVMEEAGQRQGVEPNRISFVDAWRWLRYARPEDELPVLVVNPPRPGRCEPRVRKRRPKQYPVMKRPRAELRKALMEKPVAA
jgi:hypothetical protein